MSEKYKVIDSTTPTFITITIVDWLDLLVRPIYCNILDESLNYCIQEKGLSVHAYIYMSSPRAGASVSLVSTNKKKPQSGLFQYINLSLFTQIHFSS